MWEKAPQLNYVSKELSPLLYPELNAQEFHPSLLALSLSDASYPSRTAHDLQTLRITPGSQLLPILQQEPRPTWPLCIQGPLHAFDHLGHSSLHFFSSSSLVF